MDRPADILLVDDEDAVRRSLRKALARENVEIQEARSGEEALQLLSRKPFDLVLTDIRMGGMSGLDLLAAIRDHCPDTVVVLLTGYASVESAVEALREGAQDYLIKPVSIEELRATIQGGLAKYREAHYRQEVLATLRAGILEITEDREAQGPQSQRDGEPQELRVGSVVVDRAKHAVTVGGAPIGLTPIEHQALLYLLNNRDRVVRYQELVRRVHGYDCSSGEAKRLIMPHVSNLRRKLRTAPDYLDFIQNVRGVGYTVRNLDE